ncbi:ferredoxin--NADP reductase [Amycolatopsis acidiphila]|uniref:Ferredoxin--NADP reductase n=1 Tax=Amycolatopsis acidiphila TaxID=715473 RepID=A0A558AP30_9PSEU|nr:ferredoxin--NADP reductase [Amycolatopsis acidiphila]TVT26020.1 ferredoxin--NADP reductase [Amycolatopsis acidiphila]UIJ63266.1 ferredoxin--NADP reductase [Amycolatopsis acidiphila]GHG74681.1 putative oxidoreductase [Amycolatopsis acidiphila]
MTETAARGRSRMLRIVRVAEETRDARSLVFEVPEADRDRFSYRPGQFLTLRIPSDRTGSVARCYSLASSPHEAEQLTVTVKRTADGYGSNWLCANAVEGMELEVLPPGGVFTPKDLGADLLLFAGGSGITPVFSIVKSALAQGSGKIVLVYANRDESSVIFADRLAALSARYPRRLTVIHWLESVQGLPSRGQLQALATPFTGYEAFVCGPAPFMDAVTDALSSAGMPKSRVHVEVFTSLSGDPFAEVPAVAQDTATAKSTVPAEVELAGQTYAVDWPAGTPLVDVLLAKGIDAPYSCRDGECGSCQATLLKGKVTMIRNEVLGEDDVAEGYILTCQALPDPTGTDPIKIEFL